MRTKLRLRPDNIRFFILGVSDKDISVSSSHRSLELSVEKGAHTLYIADIKTNTVIEERNPIKFLDWWKDNYNNITTNYGEE